MSKLDKYRKKKNREKKKKQKVIYEKQKLPAIEFGEDQWADDRCDQT